MRFLGKFGQENQICLLKIKVGIYTTLNMLNLIMMLNFFFDLEIPVCVNLVQKSKIVRLR